MRCFQVGKTCLTLVRWDCEEGDRSLCEYTYSKIVLRKLDFSSHVVRMTNYSELRSHTGACHLQQINTRSGVPPVWQTALGNTEGHGDLAEVTRLMIASHSLLLQALARQQSDEVRLSWKLLW